MLVEVTHSHRHRWGGSGLRCAGFIRVEFCLTFAIVLEFIADHPHSAHQSGQNVMSHVHSSVPPQTFWCLICLSSPLPFPKFQSWIRLIFLFSWPWFDLRVRFMSRLGRPLTDHWAGGGDVWRRHLAKNECFWCVAGTRGEKKWVRAPATLSCKKKKKNTHTHSWPSEGAKTKINSQKSAPRLPEKCLETSSRSQKNSPFRKTSRIEKKIKSSFWDSPGALNRDVLPFRDRLRPQKKRDVPGSGPPQGGSKKTLEKQQHTIVFSDKCFELYTSFFESEILVRNSMTVTSDHCPYSSAEPDRMGSFFDFVLAPSNNQMFCVCLLPASVEFFGKKNINNQSRPW